MVSKKKFRDYQKKLSPSMWMHIFLFVVCSFVFVVVVDILLERMEILKAPPYPNPNPNPTPPPLQINMSTKSTANTSGDCKTNADCPSCTSVCDQGKCKPTGMRLCPGSNICVVLRSDCDCNKPCDTCTQDCNYLSHQCEPAQNPGIKCPNGECMESIYQCFRNGCNPVCNSCQKCEVTLFGGIIPFYECVPATHKKTCPDGSCVQQWEACSTDCSPACDFCTQVCNKRDKVCAESLTMKRCPDGSCHTFDFDCEVLENVLENLLTVEKEIQNQ